MNCLPTLNRSLRPLLLAALCLWIQALCGCSSFVLTDGLSSASKQSLESRLALARLHEKHSTHGEASKLYEQLAKEQPKNATVRHRLAVVAVNKSDMPEALRLFREAVELSPDSPNLLNDFGYALYLNDELDEAAAQFEKAIELKPDMQAAWVNLGLVFGQQEKYAEAENAFRKANIDEAKVRCNLAYAYAQHGQLEQARDEYLRALAADSACQVAAHGLTQVSQKLPGSEPQTLVVTFSKPRPADDRYETSDGQKEANQQNEATNFSTLQPVKSGQSGLDTPE